MKSLTELDFLANSSYFARKASYEGQGYCCHVGQKPIFVFEVFKGEPLTPFFLPSWMSAIMLLYSSTQLSP